jgi:enoyl-CoA hydratase/carnithine racemase
LLADLTALGGVGVTTAEVGRAGEADGWAPGVVRIGLHRAGAAPTEGLDGFDILLSEAVRPPRPWVACPGRLDETAQALAAAVARQPAAAAVCAQVLRLGAGLGFDDALMLESIGYSMLLASQGFRAWRAASPPRTRAPDASPRVSLAMDGAALSIRLERPAARNAFDARMRDELAEALGFALDHPDAPPVRLSGAGPAFSAGGDLDEFGRADDPGRAHLVRALRSPARLAHRLGPRLTAYVHGACVGAGVEVPAAAGRVVGRPDAVFRLPELAMGLIPGAGGTASIPRRIGRQRACYMAISGADIDLTTALAWGLVDAEAAP